MIENLFINILGISITSSAAVAAILLISKFAENRFRKKWRYWIWIFLAVYLIIPIKINLPSAPIKMDVPPHEMIITQSPEIIEEPSAVPEPGEQNVQPEHGEKPFTPDLSTDEEPLSTEPKTFVFPVVFVGAVLWIFGAMIVCGWNIAMYIRFLSRSKPWNREIKDEFVLKLFECIKEEMNIPEKVKIYENRLIKSPMMVGFAKPRVLLPSEALLPEEYEFVLRHELTHYKRGDLWYKMLMMFAASVHWFNPFIGFMCRNAENDIEITCDEAVVKAMEGDRRQEYCATILNIMRRGQNSPLLLSTSFYGGKKFLKSRFAAVLNPKTHRGVVLFIIAAMVIVISGTMVACNSETEELPKTDEEIIAYATELADLIYKDRDSVENTDYKEYLTDRALSSVKQTVSASRYYIELEEITYSEYKPYLTLKEQNKSENSFELTFEAGLEFHFKQMKNGEVFNNYDDYKVEEIRLCYDFETGKFSEVTMYDNKNEVYSAEYFGSVPKSVPPEVTGPDEEGNFPLISHEDWDRWVTYEGETQTADEKPTEPISSILECPEYLEHLKEYYPGINDWEVVYETADYELVNTYDPYTYCYRNIYMPKRFAVLKTEESGDFDRLFVSTYEDYWAVYTDEGYVPQRQFQCTNYSAFESDVQVGDMSGAEIYDTIFVVAKGLWFPEEEKTIVFEAGYQTAFAVYGTKQPIHVYNTYNFDYVYDASDRRIEVSENMKENRYLYYSLTTKDFKSNMKIAAYDFETKTLVPFEGLEDYAGGFAQNYWLSSDKFIMEADGVLYFYNAENPTKLVAKIGGNGNGAYDGKVTAHAYIKEDKTHSGRYAWIYTVDDTQEHGCLIFDSEGNIIENFTFGLYGGYIGSYSFHDGLIYFSYHGSERINYAVDARPGKDHILQANAW
ncbi:MAG: M56 family metallopeptidase [Oscillospiraceae bacterium]|nr:M56 family metallopeptidase [Oscillospiraceae bacterium]